MNSILSVLPYITQGGIQLVFAVVQRWVFFLKFFFNRLEDEGLRTSWLLVLLGVPPQALLSQIMTQSS